MRPYTPPKTGPGPAQLDVLDSLGSGPLTRQQLVKETGRTFDSVRRATDRLRLNGLAECVDSKSGKNGHPGKWQKVQT